MFLNTITSVICQKNGVTASFKEVTFLLLLNVTSKLMFLVMTSR